ncbi:MAG: hypothetical protein JSS16_07600 [Proteobacteria bacterium]|nr:hypothetical protein [Pseudomonadota bacterium]
MNRNLNSMGLALALAAISAAAVQPASSGALDGWLKSQYGAQANVAHAWKGTDWKNPQADSGPASATEQRVCLDSTPQPKAPRFVAVCTTVKDAGPPTPGLVDLWQIDAANSQPALSKREVPAGWGAGAPGKVSVVQVGPDRFAFRVESGATNMGSNVGASELYLAQNGTLASWFAYPHISDYNGAFESNDPSKCRSDAECGKKFGYSTTCELHVDRTKQTDGYYALSIRVQGIDRGRPIHRSIPVPLVDGKPSLTPAELKKLECSRNSSWDQ